MNSVPLVYEEINLWSKFLGGKQLLVQIAEKYNRGQIASFNLLDPFKSDYWELQWGYVKHDPTRGHIGDLVI